jgi:hypothetical protein
VITIYAKETSPGRYTVHDQDSKLLVAGSAVPMRDAARVLINSGHDRNHGLKMVTKTKSHRRDAFVVSSTIGAAINPPYAVGGGQR